MKKGNIIDLIMYRNLNQTKTIDVDSKISDELKAAIQNLIHRLRELGPIQKSG